MRTFSLVAILCALSMALCVQQQVRQQRGPQSEQHWRQQSEQLPQRSAGVAQQVESGQLAEPVVAPPFQPPDNLRISGPHTHENLAVFLVHGDSRDGGIEILTLQKALEAKLVVLHETSRVQQLEIENLTPDKAVFIQAGDIVRGGKQDRILAIDLIIEPGSGRVAISSFCVERGRWTRRGSESTGRFSSSSNYAASNGLKLAVKQSRQQGEVWSRVARDQKRLGDNLGTTVISGESASSLELTLENKKLQATAAEYTGKLSGVLESKNSVVGVVFAINGKTYGADTYASGRLFHSLWPKLLEAAAIEAIASRNEPKADTLPTQADVQAFLSSLATAKSASRRVSKRLLAVTRETEGCVLFETLETNADGSETCIHRSYVRK